MAIALKLKLNALSSFVLVFEATYQDCSSGYASATPLLSMLFKPCYKKSKKYFFILPAPLL